MGIKSEWKKVETWWKAWWGKFKRAHIVAEDPDEGTGYEYPYGAEKGEAAEKPKDEAPSVESPAALPKPSLASCWDGENAKVRHMNELSHKFTDEQVKERLDWAVKRGCNTIHWFLVNKGDGEGAGYSIYGGAPTLGRVDEAAVARMEGRCKLALRKGMALVLWILADDSGDWLSTLLKNPDQFAADVAKTGLLKYASCIVLGLEMDEAKGADWAGLAAAVRRVWGGTVGTHHTSGRSDFAKLGDVVFWQMEKAGPSAVAAATKKALASTGKPVFMFELDRQPNRACSQAAIDAGAEGVGNW